MDFTNRQTTKWKGRVAAFLGGQGVSLFGSQIVQMAMIWYVALETSSGIWVTVLTLAAMLPQMGMSFLGGVWADRYNRKWVIIISDTIIAVTTLLLALLMMSGKMGKTALPAIIIISAIRSLGSGVQAPAVNAVLPQLVPEEELMRVNGYNGSIQSLVQFVSPMAAGAIMAVGSIHSILLMDVATAAIAIIILVFIKIPKHQSLEKTEASSVFREMKEGLQFTWNHSFLRRLLVIYGAYIFLCVPSGFLTTLMIQRTFGDNVLFLTINETVGFAGALIGGLLLGVTGGFKNRNKTFFLGTILYGIASLAVGFTNVFWTFALLMFFIGMAIPATQSAVFTLVQEKTEPSMLGRVFSLVHVIFAGFMPLGMAVFGPLSDVIRIQTLVILCAVSIVLLGLSILMHENFYKEGIHEPLPEA